MKKPLNDENKIAILIEDNPAWITMIRESMPSTIHLDYVVTLQEALDKDLSEYDIMLLDLILPDSPDPLQSFLTIFRKIQYEHKIILPIVVISGQEEAQEDILNYGASGYIHKSEWNPYMFRKTLNTAINESYPCRYTRQFQSLQNLMEPLPLSDIYALSCITY